MRRRAVLMLTLPLVLPIATLLGGCQAGKSETGTTFALIGDLPYGVFPGAPYPPLEQLVAAINAQPDVQWVMHAGDIKASITPCSDEMYQDRLQRFNGFQRPVILTPGDNEWTDCHRITAGQYQPLERLQRLREIFYPKPGTVTIGGSNRDGSSMPVHSQASQPGFSHYPENVWWERDRVIYSAIHIVGSANGLAPFSANSDAKRTAADDAEVAERTAAAVAMLEQVFAQARQSNAAGVFIMIHGNPQLERGKRGSDGRAGYLPFLTVLEQHTATFGKPVVLAHGDSHYFRIDQPPLIQASMLDNFTRVETYGFPHVRHWIKVIVKPDTATVFFFAQQQVPEE